MKTPIDAPTPIAPPPDPEAPRPFWSVMIPAYEPGEYLETTLRSVLDQDEGPDRMQIAIVDDRSPSVDVQALVRSIAGDRVEYHRNPENLRLARNWNRSIELARGRWIHILHQDDLVLPGFYRRLGLADAEQAVGAAFCRHDFIDAQGHRVRTVEPESESPGPLDNWLARISANQLIQCPSIVARRSVYERLGGFRGDLCYALDWEMWSRIALHYSFWYEPLVLAAYRSHDVNETSRLKESGRILDDIFHAISIIRESIPPDLRGGVGRGLLAWQKDESLREAADLMFDGQASRSLLLIEQACRCDPGLRWSRIRLAFQYWAFKTNLRRRLGHSAPRKASNQRKSTR